MTVEHGAGAVSMLVDAAMVGQPSINSKPSSKPTPGATKSHVSRACNNCKHAHLACDSSRPCRRCVSLGKGDTCSDLEHRRRGRPRLRRPEEDKSAEITFTPTTPSSPRAARRAAGQLVILTTNLEPAPGRGYTDSSVSSPSSASPSTSSDSLGRVPSSPISFASPTSPHDAAQVPTLLKPSARLPGSPTSAVCTCTANGRVLHMSPAAMQLVGLTASPHQQSVAGIAIHSLVHEHDHAQFEATWHAAAAGGTPRACALHLHTLHRGVALFNVEVAHDPSTQTVSLALSPFVHRGLDEFPACIESTLPRLLIAPLSHC